MWHLQYTDSLQVLYSKFNTDISMLIFGLEMSLFSCYLFIITVSTSQADYTIVYTSNFLESKSQKSLIHLNYSNLELS